MTDNSKHTPRVAIIVLNYNNWQDTVECLESIQRIDYPDYLTVVVDNGSADKSIERIRLWAGGQAVVESNYIKYNPASKPVYLAEYKRAVAERGGVLEKEYEFEGLPPNKKIVVISNGQNLGFSGGNNVGAKYAVARGYDYTIFLNNDTIVMDRDFLHKIVEVFEADNNIYVVGPKIINLSNSFDGPYIRETYWGEVVSLTVKNQLRKFMGCPPIYIDIDAVSSPRPKAVYKISGACMAFRSSFLMGTGYLDENVWLSCEEAIISEKVMAMGGMIYFQPLTLLIHKKARSPREHRDSIDILKNHFTQREYFLRSYRKYGDLKMLAISLSHNIRLLIEKLKADICRKSLQ